jgi:hypothetical protein
LGWALGKETAWEMLKAEQMDGRSGEKKVYNLAMRSETPKPNNR